MHEASDWRAAFPVEVRMAAADDIPLSTASGRDTAYIAAHVPAGTRPGPWFAALEAIAGEVGGRPHWGKLHGLDAAALRARYPRFDEFVAVRDRLDPAGVLANAYLDRVLGRPRSAEDGRSGGLGSLQVLRRRPDPGRDGSGARTARRSPSRASTAMPAPATARTAPTHIGAV